MTQIVSTDLYSGKYKLSFYPNSHRYRINGEYKQGVTSFLNVLNKPNLIQWAASMAVDTFYQAYQENPKWTKKEFAELAKRAKYAHLTFKDEAALVGKNVHYWIEEHIKGSDAVYDELMRPSIESYLKWEKRVKPHYIASERPIYAEAEDYCGTLDILAEIEGQRTVIDLKTGSPDKEYDPRKKVYSGKMRARTEHFLQDGAYENGIRQEDGVKSDKLMVIYLPLDGSIYVYETSAVDKFVEGFKHIVDLSRALKELNLINEWS